MLKVGLTGNIGSGKTLVGEIFRILNIPVFQADIEAKMLYRREEIKAQLAKITGKDIFNQYGAIEPKKMAKVLFSNKELLEKVNRLIHPLVREQFRNLTEINEDKPFCIYEAAILVESGYYKELDKLIVVDAPETVRSERVIKRDRIDLNDFMKRAANQFTDEQKRSYADWVIYNDGTRMVIPQVLQIDKELRILSN